jgi:hypothetical protein
MRRLWFGLFLLSSMWLLALPILTQPCLPESLVCLILGLSLNIWALWDVRPRFPLSLLLLFLIPIGLLIRVLPFPFQCGPVLMLIGGVLSVLNKVTNKSHGYSGGILFSGLVMVIQAFFFPAVVHFVARNHELAGFSRVFSQIAEFAGIKSGFDPRRLFVGTVDGVSPITVTLEALGVVPLALITVGGIATIILFSSKKMRSLLVLLGVSSVYAVLRFFLLILAFSNSKSPSVFWEPHLLILTFLLLPIGFARAIPLSVRQREGGALPLRPLSSRALVSSALVFVGVFSYLGFWHFQDPGVKKPGRVLIDEGHSNWEWTEKKYDTEWFGPQSGYNYYCFKEYISCYFQVSINHDAITPCVLQNCDVLILKMPTRPFTAEESEAISVFVRRGGGLLLIGDHTNVFGSGTYLNQVAIRFGFRYKYDSTYDLETSSLSLYGPRKVSFIAHPALGCMPFFLFATSCTLEAPLGSEDVMIGYGLKGLDADYSQRNFFPKITRTDMNFGLFVQMSGRKNQKGRVLLFTDSTVFSNFYMFMPGKPELILGSIDWLNRINKWNFLQFVFGTAALLVLMMVIVLAGRAPAKSALFMPCLFAAFLAFSGGLIVFESLTKSNYPAPKPQKSFLKVAFDGEHSLAYFPAAEFDPERKDGFSTFFIWVQRLGLVPELKFRIDECLGDHAALVIVNPSRPYKEKEIVKFRKWIQQGGQALILDDPRNIKTSTAHQLLSPFGLSLEYYEVDKGLILDKEGKIICDGAHLGRVQGGEPVLFIKRDDSGEISKSGAQKLAISRTKSDSDHDTLPLCARVQSGKGAVTLLGCSSIFFDEQMGVNSVVPDAKQRKIFELEFFILSDLLNMKSEAKKH